MLELTINFPNPRQVKINFDGEESEQFLFNSPLNLEDFKALQWYIEEYSSNRYGDEVYDDRAKELERNFPLWGQKLFKAVFQANSSTYQIYLNFRNQM